MVKSIIKFLKGRYHLMLSYLGRVLYMNPSKSIFVVGVTGTKGKTTVIEIINFILESAGFETAISSSLRIKIKDQSGPNKQNTMPGRLFLHKFLRKAVDAGADFALLEVTSEGVAQHRHRNIHFNSAILTNLQPEHIESHGSFEKYREAKLKFFRDVARDEAKPDKVFIINKDDPNYKYFSDAVLENKTTFYSKSNLESNMPGEFNKYNIGAAAAFLKEVGVDELKIEKGLKDFIGVSGRMELVVEKPFKVIVDYAHTPDSLEAVYKTLSSEVKIRENKLVCVLGSAGGGRDKWKRPKMGEIAALYCKEIILTNEDPYDEDPDKIINEIEAGILGSHKPNFETNKNYWRFMDRREAIEKAMSLAKKNDIVIITGKGSEPHIHLAHGATMEWSDKKVVMEVLKGRKSQ
ncbi:MAG TPA: Mur ligase family protein [Candidatus Paceibacterota bacterium]